MQVCLCINSIPGYCRAGFLPWNPGNKLHVSLSWQQHNKRQNTTFHDTCVIQPGQFTKQDTDTDPDMYRFPNSWSTTIHCAHFLSALFQIIFASTFVTSYFNHQYCNCSLIVWYLKMKMSHLRKKCFNMCGAKFSPELQQVTVQ